MRENITRHYKSSDEDAYDEINAEAQIIASELDSADRMDVMAKREAFITLKDHKDNFEDSLPCRLINPAKSEMGLVSKRILDNRTALGIAAESFTLLGQRLTLSCYNNKIVTGARVTP